MPAVLSQEEREDAYRKARIDEHTQKRLQNLWEVTETLNQELSSINVMLQIRPDGQVVLRVKCDFECRVSDISKLFDVLKENPMSINHVVFIGISMSEQEVVYEFLDGIVDFFTSYADERCFALRTFRMSNCANIYTMFHSLDENYKKLESVRAMSGWSVRMPEAPGSFFIIEKRL